MYNRMNRRIAATILTTLFISANSITIASEITGVNGNNGVYNINPSAVIQNTNIGYRKYKDFILDKNDIANLIFKYGITDIETFINLVDNKININGIVNSMRDGNFYNGKAVFVSPNGMVVGASGVLNVGSLSVTTPTQQTYDYYKANPNKNLSGLYATNSNSTVQIDGTVITANNVDINSGKVIVSKSRKYTFRNSNNIAINSNSQAENLFNNLVNIDNIHSAGNLTKCKR